MRVFHLNKQLPVSENSSEIDEWNQKAWEDLILKVEFIGF